ncbi:MAG: DNA polymerase III subunit beta [Candidatus Vogelbacteria bacterium CG10_big_fil_rev_8_21_14_0_10_49_38]|uniref:Beta sliding clamp n=1 Tax=Candidatus Vogelbacteria bacterium CG10_big_fil_rev_8_21_14_0_10_49_38 TaxID=1975043 RepID=A0A2H0RGR5_9BACT|nr:MAG: DNA polymerase III subunit beta [bacterium CG10_49_38]PIR45742.1 MAG: DNA polymerase III subunit beta [Candidatus Vogelbacteria bacterium CG10_big_fil_rev_8_21_14_0_10_49_38]
MKLECVKERIKEAVILAEKISGRNLTLPILSAILLEVKGKNLIIRSTNLENGIEIEIPIKNGEDGLIAVNAGVLVNYLSNLKKEDRITLETDKDNLKLTTDSTSTLIKSLPLEDFPIIPKIDLKTENTDSFEIKAVDLNEGLKSVFFASAVSDLKPEISSIYIYNQDQDLVFVATDSFRLAEKRVNLVGLKKDINIIIPFKNINELIKVLDSLDGTVSVIFNKNQLVVSTDDLYFTLRVIDGVYPDYKQIIPVKFKTELTLKKEDLMNLLKLATVFSDRFNQINLNLKPNSNLLELTSYNQEIGENNSTLVAKITGEPLEISFNAKYLLDCLGVLNENSIKMQFTDHNRPLIISSPNKQSFSYLVMPINK